MLEEPTEDTREEEVVEDKAKEAPAEPTLKGKRIWTKEKPKKDPKSLPKKKPKFRYETKAERKATRVKQKSKNQKAAASRKSGDS